MTFVGDDFGNVVAAMRPFGTGSDAANVPYYTYGHPREINRKLLKKTNDPAKKFKKYPLIALLLDLSEDYNKDIITYKLHVLILTNTSMGLDAEERVEQTLNPILQPLWESLMEQLDSTGIFYWDGGKIPNHTKIFRPFWGTDQAGSNTKNIFSDPLDAIEIIDLELRQDNKC